MTRRPSGASFHYASRNRSGCLHRRHSGRRCVKLGLSKRKTEWKSKRRQKGSTTSVAAKSVDRAHLKLWMITGVSSIRLQEPKGHTVIEYRPGDAALEQDSAYWTCRSAMRPNASSQSLRRSEVKGTLSAIQRSKIHTSETAIVRLRMSSQVRAQAVGSGDSSWKISAACSCHIDQYSPRIRISSSCVPRSKTSPSLSTIIKSVKKDGESSRNRKSREE